ncbi:MAG TPA: energy transducer TonB [Blastocatellia bacterium]|nr:energy transducer TonB [Blastocatellia bacterium]
MKIYLMTLCMYFSATIQPQSFEKLAISSAQRITASSLDAKLPNHSFGAWLDGLVGQDVGVVWQLAECGVGAPGESGQDLPACAEAIMLLSTGDTMIVSISVGSFKKGLIGVPTFRGGVIKSGERLYQVRRLCDLPEMLRSPRSIPMLDLQADTQQAVIRPSMTYLPPAPLSSGNNIFGSRFPAPDDEAPPPPPPPRSKQSSGDLVDASVITKVKPVYPAAARILGFFGKVEVRVVISETGRVIEATALSGNATLRAAALAAARQWVYKPATQNGVPVKTESVLTFTFTPVD